ncbi:sensor histidine kinase [Demequina sp.]|uniref:sensor histidine kinase n=1 Tax=Demequina sp. TaxID=2050685 RepID=UPI003D13C4D6
MRVKTPRLGDSLIAASVLLLTFVSAFARTSQPQGAQREWDVLGFVLVTLLVLPLAWRQLYPKTVAWATTAVWIVVQGLGYPDSLAVIAPFIAIYGLAVYLPRRSALIHGITISALLMTWTAVGLIATGFVNWTALLSVAFGTVLPLLMGFGERSRASRLAELERAHARQEQAEAEVAREAVATERARIARELHDVVAHEMTVMTLQAEGARRLAADADPRIAEALGTISASGRSGLAEMQRMIGVLRADADGTQGLTPAPALADLPALARQVRESGMPVRLVITGDAPTPAGVELNAFRIIQEGLTNALKYAGPGASATVEVRKAPGSLTVEVRDDGRGGSANPSPSGGHGVVGMRERVEALGGSFDIGPAAGGGYRLRAVLPTSRALPDTKRPIGTLTGDAS